MKVLFNEQIKKDLAYKLKEIKKGYKIPIISDTMFHVMLNNEKRKKYSAYLIALSLKENYDEILNSIELVKNKIDKDKYIEKSKTVDFVCKIKDNVVNIEMNNNVSKGELERNLSYLFDLYKSNVIRGGSYSYSNVVQININNFTFSNNKNTIECHMLKSDDTILTDKIKFYNIYLPNIRQKMYNKEKLSELERLLLVLNEEGSTSKSIGKGYNIMEEYINDAIDASEDDNVIGLYDKEMHDKLKENTRLKESYEKGIEQGINSRNIEIAKSMLDKSIDDNIISEITGLSKEEINKLM